MFPVHGIYCSIGPSFRYENVTGELQPTSPAEAIKQCDRDMYQNIFVHLQIVCALRVSSSECERRASALRRLNNFMRASMGKKRLSSLAFLHIHYDEDIDFDRAVDAFAKKHSRRIELDSLITP